MMAAIACKTLTGTQEVLENAEPSAASVETEQISPSSTPIEPAETVIERATPSRIESEFPLPGDVFNYLEQDGGANFQSSMNLSQALDFYRMELTAQGLTERQLLTVVEEDVFSVVFDGAPNDQALVIQGVRLEAGGININIRYEDI